MFTRLAVVCLAVWQLPAQQPVVVTAPKQTLEVNDKMPGVSVDRQGNASQITLSAAELDLLPALDNDVLSPLLDFLNAGSGGPSIVIDGIETDRMSISANTIKEIRINQDPYAAEWARPGSSRIEITTRTAGERLRGSLQAAFRDSNFDARNAFALVRPPERRRRIDGRLSGPFLGNGFALTFEQAQEDVQSIVLARLPQGELRQNVPVPESELDWSAAWQRARPDGNALSLRYESDRERAGNAGVGGFSLPEAASSYAGREQELSFGWRSLLRTGVLSELSLRVEEEGEQVSSLYPDLQRVVVEGAFTGGSAQTDTSQREVDLKINHAFSWSRGRHFLRGGYQVPRISRVSVKDRSNRAGTIVYGSLESYLSGSPLSSSIQTGSGEVGFWRRDVSLFMQDDFRLRSNLQLGFGLRWDSQAMVASATNLAPRLSIAYAAAKNHVLRGGVGVFYDRLDGSAILAGRLRDGVTLREAFTIFGTETLYRSSVYRLQDGIRSPLLLQYSVSVDSKWRDELTTSFTYLKNVGSRLYRSQTFPALGIRQLVDSTGSMSAQSLEASVRGRFSKLWTWSVQYRYGRSYDDTSGVDSFPASNESEWGRASYDTRHRLQAMGSFDAWKRVQIGWFFRAQAGSPYNVTTGRDDNGDGLTRDRPSGVRRNSLEGSPSRTLDLRLAKVIKAIRFTFDAFNALNQVNYTNFIGNQASPYFGHPVAARSARRLQASAGVRF